MALMATSTTAKQMAELFIQTHNAWVDSPHDLLTDEYEEALKACVDEFKTADMPSDMRDLLDAVAELGVRYDAYEDYVTKRQPMPRSEFWAAVSMVKDALAGQEITYQRTIEPVDMLLAQGVSHNQIAHHIYGCNGEGPFLRNGVTNSAAILQEVKEPGSIIKVWVHPNERERVATDRKREARRLERLEQKTSVNIPVGPETFEELFKQGVPINQIADIKQCSVEQVMAEAKRIGVKPVLALNTNTISPYENAPSAAQLRQADPVIIPSVSVLEDSTDAIEADELDELLESGDAPEDQAENIKAQIAALWRRSGGKLEPEQIMKEFNVGKSKAARLLRQAQNEEAK